MIAFFSRRLSIYQKVLLVFQLITNKSEKLKAKSPLLLHLHESKWKSIWMTCYAISSMNVFAFVSPSIERFELVFYFHYSCVQSTIKSHNLLNMFVFLQNFPVIMSSFCIGAIACDRFRFIMQPHATQMTANQVSRGNNSVRSSAYLNAKI